MIALWWTRKPARWRQRYRLEERLRRARGWYPALDAWLRKALDALDGISA